MNRRTFLKLLSRGTLLSYGVVALPPLSCARDAMDYALEGQNLIQREAFSEAAIQLEKAAALDPNNDWVRGLLGRAYHKMGRLAEAVEQFRKATHLNPGDTYSRMMIDWISQKPIPRLKKVRRPPTPLEDKAYREETARLKTLRTRQSLDYQVNRVVIDPGHGGFDSGAIGLHGLKEKDVTLDLARRLHGKLNRHKHIKSFLTRTGDYYVPLNARTVAANQFRADLFISLHINAYKSRETRGAETYFCSERASSAEAEKVAALENAVIRYDEPYVKEPGFIDIEEFLFRFEQKLNWSESGLFAEGFQQRIEQLLPFDSRGVHSANFYVLRRAKMPAILLETGFISNPDNEAMLRQPIFRDKIANAIVQGIV